MWNVSFVAFLSVHLLSYFGDSTQETYAIIMGSKSSGILREDDGRGVSTVVAVVVASAASFVLLLLPPPPQTIVVVVVAAGG